MSKSVRFYYFYGDICYIEDNKVYYICQDGVIRLSSCSASEVDRYFEFIEEVFNY